VVLSWVPDWSWGLPLLILTIVAHVCAIVFTAKILGKNRASDAHRVSRFISFVAFAALASSCAIFCFDCFAETASANYALSD
jgi:hypothetical protein